MSKIIVSRPHWLLLPLLGLATGPCLARASAGTVPSEAPTERRADSEPSKPAGLMADSPVTFPEKGALPSKYPPDIKTEAQTGGIGSSVQR